MMATQLLIFGGLLLLASSSSAVDAFYIPIKPISYDEGDPVPVDVNGLHSNTALLPMEYYTLPFCRPPTIQRKHEALGEVLMGDRVESSLYSFNMARNTKCRKLACSDADTVVDEKKLAALEKAIEQNYRGYLVLDNLPVFNNGSLVYDGLCKGLPRSEQYEFLRGYALGVTKRCTGQKTLINNHLEFRVQYHKTPDGDYRVVGFTAKPYSIDHEANGGGCDSTFQAGVASARPLTTDPAKTKRITWSYSVRWVEEPNIQWASRWDSYLHTSFADVNTRVHWFSIVNSMLVVFCLLAGTFMALVRSLRRDFARYNEILAQLETKEAAEEETGWKTVSQWVVIPPENVNWLIVAVSTGAQTLGMALSVLFFACLGFLSPANRGALAGATVLLYVIQAFIAGYVCARMLKRFSERSWGPVLQTGVVLPGLLFTLFFVLNTLSWARSTGTAVPALTVLALLVLWLGIALPLTILGAAFGFSAEPNRDDRRDPPALRPIPVQEWYLTNAAVLVIPGLVPFGAAFLELRFILASLWQGKVYYVFGFLTLVMCLWCLCCALVAVITVYYRLCAENYNWWWVAFLVPTGGGLHMALYSLYYFSTQLSITTGTATVMYVTYMAMTTALYVLTGGAIGFFAVYLFQRRIYNAVKRD